MKRRRFLKTLSGAVYAGTAGSLHGRKVLDQKLVQTGAHIRVGLLDEPSFPSVDGVAPLPWKDLLKDSEVLLLSVADLGTRLSTKHLDLFINPYGSAFPLEAWRPIREYLMSGGNWLNLGGVPLSTPISRKGSDWRVGTRLTAYHKKIGITQSFPVPGRAISSYQRAPSLGSRAALADDLNAEEISELYVRFSSTSDFPDEAGSSGSRDAVLTPLVFGVNPKGRQIAAPVVQIDRLQGDYAGGRWVLANFKGTIGKELFLTLAKTAAQGAQEFTVHPGYACYRSGESPTIKVELRRPSGGAELIARSPVRIEVRDSTDNLVSRLSVPLHASTASKNAVIKGEETVKMSGSLAPGLYRVDAQLGAPAGDREWKYTTGFWLSAEPLLAGGKPFTTDRHFLHRDGSPYPVTGTTYMASDVHRQFLSDPNPNVWDQDFRAMKEAGVNMVRTGLWTGWTDLMREDGTVSEVALRALDAFLLTARRYDIPVIFTFFAFLPHTWGGVNAYLDPRAIKFQQLFISAFANRYRASDDLIWDLINEPSFCNPKHLWNCRPNYDQYEQSAWVDWLKEKYPAPTEEARRDILRELWRTADEELLGLPRLEDFENVNILEGRLPLKTIDYKLFAQEMFNRWARLMVACIRRNGNERQLITVGQDEAGAADSPAPQFFAREVNFTSLHNWWANDDLLWDGVVTKAPSKPNLVEETGVMFYEKMDGSAWRTEESARDLLGRKMAISLGANSSGFIEWVWNTNCYMTSDNEVAIGFHRVDQTAKPELEPFVEVAKFASEHKARFRNKHDEDVLLVIPHTHLFSTRNFATEASRNCVRAMHYHCQISMRAASEYNLHELRETPKLIVIPSPRVLQETCWSKLISLADSGSTVLITGVFDADANWRPADRTRALNWESTIVPVAQSEFVRIGDAEHHVRYAGEKIQRVEKAVLAGEVTAHTKVKPLGKGYFIWCPLPLELGQSLEPVVSFYRQGLAQSGLKPSFTTQLETPEVLIRTTRFENAVFYTFVSETERDTEVRLQDRDTQTKFSLVVRGRRTALVMIDSATGKVVGSTGDVKVGA